MSEVIRNEFERDVASYYDGKKEDFNLLLAREDDLVHHHFGMGDFDRRLIGDGQGNSQEAILDELHLLENRQVAYIADALDPVARGGRVLDGGCGRGGTALMLHERLGCRIDGVTISDYQCDFSRRLAVAKGLSGHLAFHHCNMVETGFQDARFDGVVTNETTMYVEDLDVLFAEFRRMMVTGGRYVLMTWCIEDIHPDPSRWAREIDEHYVCKMHTRRRYLEALLANDLVPKEVLDLTTEAIPYWELRKHSEHKTGVEDAYLDGYLERAICYLLISSEAVRV